MRCILFILLLLATSAKAGPWPRDEGRLFLAVGNEYTVSRVDGLARNFSTFYAEYGLTERYTIGLDAGGENGQPQKIIAFLRVPVLEEGRTTRFAFEVGVGEFDNEAAIRPGFTLGRGFSIGEHNGWATLDTHVALSSNPDSPTFSADFTLGVSATDRLKLIAQLQTGMRTSQSGTIKFAPSFVYERKPGHHLQIGVIAGIRDSTAYGVKINTWRNF